MRVFQSAKLIGKVDVDPDAANRLRQIPDYFSGVCCIAVNINGERWRSAAGQANGSTEHFRLFHPFIRNFQLNGNGSTNGWMIVIHRWGGIRREWMTGEKQGEKTDNNFQQERK